MHSTNHPKLGSVLANPLFACGLSLSLLFILPKYGATIVMWTCAATLTAYVVAFPDTFRDRKGSSKLANALVLGMWVLAGIVTLLSLTGVAN